MRLRISVFHCDHVCNYLLSFLHERYNDFIGRKSSYFCRFSQSRLKPSHLGFSSHLYIRLASKNCRDTGSYMDSLNRNVHRPSSTALLPRAANDILPKLVYRLASDKVMVQLLKQKCSGYTYFAAVYDVCNLDSTACRHWTLRRIYVLWSYSRHLNMEIVNYCQTRESIDRHIVETAIPEFPRCIGLMLCFFAVYRAASLQMTFGDLWGPFQQFVVTYATNLCREK